MSSIPDTAMPKAVESDAQSPSLASRATAQARRAAGLVRGNPKTAIAAGAAVAAGVATAAVVRARRGKGAGTEGGGKSGGGSKKKKV